MLLVTTTLPQPCTQPNGDTLTLDVTHHTQLHPIIYTHSESYATSIRHVTKQNKKQHLPSFVYVHCVSLPPPPLHWTQTQSVLCLWSASSLSLSPRILWVYSFCIMAPPILPCSLWKACVQLSQHLWCPFSDQNRGISIYLPLHHRIIAFIFYSFGVLLCFKWRNCLLTPPAHPHPSLSPKFSSPCFMFGLSVVFWTLMRKSICFEGFIVLYSCCCWFHLGFIQFSPIVCFSIFYILLKLLYFE